MNLSPVWDYKLSPKIEITKSQLDRLAQDETYLDSFLEWINDKLQVQGDMTTGTIRNLDGTVRKMQPRANNIVHRLSDSIYNTVSQVFSTQKHKFVLQVDDGETARKVDCLRQNVIPILSTLLNGSLERYVTQKRLGEAYTEIEENIPSTDVVRTNENKDMKEILKLIEKYDVEGKDVMVEDWMEKYEKVTNYPKIPKKTVALVRAFDVRLLRRHRLRELIKAIETMDSQHSVSKKIEDLDKQFQNKDFEVERFYDKSGSAIFACDAKKEYSLSCADEDNFYNVTKILEKIDIIQKTTEKSLNELRKEVLSVLLQRLRKFADGKTVVYENLLDLFESSDQHEFARQLREEYIPIIHDMSDYSSFLVANWRSFVNLIHILRSKLETINPSTLQLSILKAGTGIAKELEDIRNEETRNSELEKRCSYNRLVTIFSDIDNTIGATSLGGPLSERLRNTYFRVWGSLQQVVNNDKVDARIFCDKTLEALKNLVEIVDSSAMTIPRESDCAVKLLGLNSIWEQVSAAINEYSKVVKDDRQTLPVILDNQVFQIEKAHSLLPRSSDKIEDTVSNLTFKIYYMQIFFTSLYESAKTLRKHLKVDQTSKQKNPFAKANTRRIIDEIQYRGTVYQRVI